MEYFNTIFPAITALVGVFIGFGVQGVIEWSRRKHESKIGKRAPLTAACEDLCQLLEYQMYAIVTIEAMIQRGIDVSQDENLGVLLKKEYRKKLWAIVENPEMLGAINTFAKGIESVSGKLVTGHYDDGVLSTVQEARNALGASLKILTKHTASIWELSFPLPKEQSSS